MYGLQTNDPELIEQIRSCHRMYSGLFGTPSEIAEFIGSLAELEGIELLFDDTDAEKLGPVQLSALEREVIVTGMMM